MDNVTHTLVSALLGAGVAHATRGRASGLPEATRTRVLMTTMAIGGNVPDLDLLYTGLHGGKLEYLLHHRGHTHTLLGAIAGAVLLYLAVRAWLRWRRMNVQRADAFVLAGAALLAVLLHIAMDFTNNYGVHPFWPWNNRWVYGDRIFIIEPLLWTACAPLLFVVRSLAARIAIGVVLLTGVALCFLTGLVPLGAAVFVAALTAVLLTIGKRCTPRVALSAAVLAWLGVTATFAVAGNLAERRAQTLARLHYPDAQLDEVMLTPSPANPLCWDATLIQRQADEAALRQLMVSVAPRVMRAAECRARSLSATVTAPVRASGAPEQPDAKWYGEVVFSHAALAMQVASDCRAAAFMQFARAPWLAARDAALVLGDLRYDREAELGFAEIDLNERPVRCPNPLPPWTPPRLEWLR